MVYDTLLNLHRYKALLGSAAVLVDRLSELSELPTGVHEFHSFKVLAQDYAPMERSERFWESHRQFVDLQIMLSGTEAVVIGFADAMKRTRDYSAEKDLQLWEGDGQIMLLHSGQFMILFPDDVHMPALKAEGTSERVQKIVVKIPLLLMGVRA